MAYWNNVYPTQPVPYNYVPNNNYNMNRPQQMPQEPPKSTTPEKASGSGSAGCITAGIVTGLLVIAALVIPITLALTNTGPFSTSVAPANTTSTPSTLAPTTTSPWPQCSFYLTINDSTRLSSAGVANLCDTNFFTSNITWVRFLPPGGTQLATTMPNTNQCGTQATGWYNGTMPSTGMTVNGTVCYNWGSSCNWSNSIRVTNCGGFFVFGLVAPPACNLRYCTS